MFVSAKQVRENTYNVAAVFCFAAFANRRARVCRPICEEKKKTEKFRPFRRDRRLF